MPFSRDIGATLMAAGASSPELFSSFVALFITHSAMGLGTVRHQYSMSIFS
jgi:Ca2+/Na+ antiporter